MSTKAAEKRTKENGHPTCPLEAKESTCSSADSAAPCTNGQDRSGVNSSLCADSDGDSSIVADDSLCSTPTHRKFKVPSQRPRTSKSEKKRVSNASFSHEHSQVLELEREVRKLLAERNQLSKQLYSSKQDNTKLESKVQVAVRDKSALMSQMASLSKHNRDLSRGKRILLAKAFSSVDVRKTRSLEQSLKQANREKRAKQKELEKLNIQMNMSSKEMQEKLLTWLDEREEREIRIEDLECEVQHLTECQAATEEENNALKESVAAQEEACKILKDKQTQFELAYQDKEKEVCEVRERLTEERDQLKQSLHSAEDTVVELEKMVSSLTEQLSDKSQQITTLESDLQASESEVEVERGRREGTEEQLAQYREQFSEKVDSVERRLADLTHLNSDLKLQLESSQTEVEKERGRREGTEVELAQCKEQLREKVDSLEKRVVELSHLNSELQSQLKSSQTAVETERGRREGTEVELAKCREQLGEKVDSLEKRVVELSHLNSNLQSQLKTSEAEVETERGRREGTEAELAQSRVQLGEVGERVALMENREGKLSQLNSDLQAQLDSLRLELERERGLRQQVEEKLTTKTTQLTDKDTEIERVQQKHAGDLEAAHAKCSGLLLDLEKVVSEGKETQALLKSKLDVVEADRQKAVHAAKEAREKEQVVSSQLTQLKKENVELQAVRASMQEKLEQVQDELAGLQEQVDGSSEAVSKEAVVAVQEQMTRELVEVQLKLTHQQRHTTKVQNELEEKVHELEEELEKMKTERELLEMAYLDLQEKCRPFQDQIEGLADVNALLHSQAALARKEAQEASDQFASLVGHQNSRQKIRYVKKIRDENTALKMELNQLRMELTKQKKQIRRIQNEAKAGPAPTNPARPLSSKN